MDDEKQRAARNGDLPIVLTTTVLRGYKGSTTESNAKKSGLMFKAIKAPENAAVTEETNKKAKVC